jgi:hypothetical protein
MLIIKDDRLITVISKAIDFIFFFSLGIEHPEELPYRLYICIIFSHLNSRPFLCFFLLFSAPSSPSVTLQISIQGCNLTASSDFKACSEQPSFSIPNLKFYLWIIFFFLSSLKY